MTDQDRNRKKNCYQRKRQVLLRGERHGSQVLSSQPLETARETERVNIVGHVDRLCACVDFPDREAESDVHSVYKEGENSYIHCKGLFQSPSVSHTLPL